MPRLRGTPEYDDAPSKILAHHWPDVPNHGDITAVDWAAVEPVSIITAGFPCQDVSTAGRRAGLRPGTRTGLFHNTIEAIDAIRPDIAVLENVAGLRTADGEPWPTEVGAARIAVLRIDVALKRATGHERNRLVRQRKRAVARFDATRRRLVQRAIGTVVGELAAIGYDSAWTGVRASDVGAPHERDRIFILAYPADTDDSEFARQPNQRAGREASTGDRRGLLLPTPVASPSGGTAENHLRKKPGRKVVTDLAILVENGLLATGGVLPTPTAGLATGGPDYARAGRAGSGGDDLVTIAARAEQGRGANWGKYAAAIRLWEELLRPAPPPTEPNSNGRPHLNAAFAEWMMGLDGGWVTDVPGLSRSAQLKAIGNGVCPQQAYRALGDLWHTAGL